VGRVATLMPDNVLEIPRADPNRPYYGNNPYFNSPTIPTLMSGWIMQESGGNPGAIGKDGEIGLLQIMPRTAAQYGITPEQLRDPRINLQTAQRYLSDLLRKYRGSMYLALAAYNDGPGNVDKWLRGERELPASTRRYVSNVLGGRNADQLARRAPPETMSALQSVGGGVPLMRAQTEPGWGPTGAAARDLGGKVLGGMRDFVQPTIDLADRARTLIGSAPHELARLTGRATTGVLTPPLGERAAQGIGMGATNALELANAGLMRGVVQRAGDAPKAWIRQGFAPGLGRVGPQFIGPGGDEYQRPQITQDLIDQVGQYPQLVTSALQRMDPAKLGNLMEVAPPSIRAQLGALLGPSAAQAAEGPPGSEPMPAAATEAEPPGSEAMPAADAGPPGTEAMPPAAPAPPVAATQQPLPLPVRIADWAPTVGQFGGEFVGGVGAAPVAAGAATVPVVGGPLALGVETGGVGLGGGLGAAGGEEISELVRSQYGLPPQPGGGVGGAFKYGTITSAAGVPGGKILAKGAKLIPGVRRALEARGAYEKATTAAKELEGKIAQRTGLSELQAIALRQVRDATERAVRAVLDIDHSIRSQLGAAYDYIIKPTANHVTQGTSLRAVAHLANEQIRAIAALTDRRLGQGAWNRYLRYPTVELVHQVRSAARAVRAGLNPETQRAEIELLRTYEQTLTSDLKSGLSQAFRPVLDRLDQQFAKHMADMPHAIMQKIRNARSIVEVGNIIRDPSTLNILLRDVQRIPDKARRFANLHAIREAIGSALWTAAGKGGSEPQRLGNLMTFIRQLPEESVKRLWGFSRKELLDAGQETRMAYDAILKNPSMHAAIDTALRKYTQEGSAIAHYLQHHLMWTAFTVGGGVSGYEHGGWEGAISGGVFGLICALGLARFARTEPALNFYRRAATETLGNGNPERIARHLRNAVAALFDELVVRPNVQPTPTPGGTP